MDYRCFIAPRIVNFTLVIKDILSARQFLKMCYYRAWPSQGDKRPINFRERNMPEDHPDRVMNLSGVIPIPVAFQVIAAQIEFGQQMTKAYMRMWGVKI